MNWFANRAHRLREDSNGVVRRHVAGIKMNLRCQHVIAGDEPMKDLSQEAALDFAQSSNNTEINRHQRAIWLNQQVALVHIGMKETVAHGLP